MKFIKTLPVILAALPGLFMAIAGFLDLGAEPVEITVALLSGAAGWILSWFVERNKKISSWFATLTTIEKSRVFVGFLALVSLAVVAAACSQYTADFFSNYIVMTCNRSGFVQIGEAFFMAVLASQGRFQLYTKPARKQEILDRYVGSGKGTPAVQRERPIYDAESHGGEVEN